MDGFFLLLGHLLGDYVVQNDWMAANKTAPLAGKPEHTLCQVPAADVGAATAGAEACERAYRAKVTAEWRGHLACTAHCWAYTAAVWACSFWWMPWWGLVVCFAAHWPMDRFRLAGHWMRTVSGQTAFASGPLAPWSVIVVDNVLHLLTLGLIAAAAGRVA